MHPVLSIIYVYYNTPLEIRDSIESINKALNIKSYEVIIVDNASTKRLKKDFLSNGKISYIRNSKNIGFSAACNQAASIAKGKYLLFINPDTIFTLKSIQKMLEAIIRDKKIGILGPCMMDSKGKTLNTVSSKITFFYALVSYTPLRHLWAKKFIDKPLPKKSSNVDILGGACLLIPKDVFSMVSGFDERFFMYFEEHDICQRIKSLGYKIVYRKDIEIVHLVGRSESSKKKISNYFEKSRFEYFKKYFGIASAVLLESIIRLSKISVMLPLLIGGISLFLNIYRQKDLMLFIGDAARDYLAARDMLLTGVIPIVGIPSSVTWLHQGPTSIYFIALSFLVTNFNPVAPAILFGIMGAITTWLVYYVGYKFFNYPTGIIASLIYATAPIIVVNARMPYHTSLIPFFSLLFAISIFYGQSRRNYMPITFLFLGLLLLVELSNLVMIGVIFMFFAVNKIRLSFKQIIASIFFFLIGIVPFVLYDFTHGPTYLKFPLWVIRRIYLFFVSSDSFSPKDSLPLAFSHIYQFLSGSIAPHLGILSLFLLFISIVVLALFGGRKYAMSKLIVLWIVIPLLSFVLHASPGTAYFAVLYPAIALSVGFLFSILLRRKTTLLFLSFIIIGNVYLLIKNDFFVTTISGGRPMPPTGYNFGSSIQLVNDPVKAILKDTKGKPFKLVASQKFGLYKTSVLPFNFIIWKNGGRLDSNSTVNYVILTNSEKVPINSTVIYKNPYVGVVARYE